jgi:hypothetical protein
MLIPWNESSAWIHVLEVTLLLLPMWNGEIIAGVK